MSDCLADGYNLESDNVVFCGAAKSILQARGKADGVWSNACEAYDDFKSKKAPRKFDVKAPPRPEKQKAKVTPEAVVEPEKPKRALTYKQQKQAAFDVYINRRMNCPKCKGNDGRCPTCQSNFELWQSF